MSLPAPEAEPPEAKLANGAGDFGGRGERAAVGRLGLGHRGGPLVGHLVLARVRGGGCGVVS